MKTRTLTAFLVLALAFFAFSCGGGGGGGTNPAPPDTTPPVITINGANPATVAVGAAYNDPGATAWDETDGNIFVEVSGLPVDTSVPGDKSVDYTACDTSGNESSKTRTVRVVANPPPTAAIQASETSITQGQSVTISWQTSGGTVSIPGIGNNLPANSAQSVTPSATTAYTVTVIASDSQVATASVTVNVGAVTPPPTAAIQASETSITQGQSVTISWQTSGGTVSIPGIGSNLPANGSQSFTPASTTTCTVTVTAPDSQVATASVTVNVTTVQPALWKVAGYNLKNGVETDGTNIFAIGVAYSPIESVIAKFNPNGTTTWTADHIASNVYASAYYNGALYVLRNFDPSGIYIGGGDVYAEKYDAGTKALLWSTLVGTDIGLAHIAVGSAGIFAAGTNAVYKLDFNGTLASSNPVINWIGTGRVVLGIDTQGTQVAVTGYSDVYAVTALYTDAGAQVFLEYYNPGFVSPSFLASMAEAVKFHSDGTIRVVGGTVQLGTGGNSPAFRLKYAATGGLPEVKNLDPNGFAWDIDLGSGGEEYISLGAGSSVGLLRLNTDGSTAWTAAGGGNAIAVAGGKVFQANETDTLAVYDAATGQKLN